MSNNQPSNNLTTTIPDSYQLHSYAADSIITRPNPPVIDSIESIPEPLFENNSNRIQLGEMEPNSLPANYCMD